MTPGPLDLSRLRVSELLQLEAAIVAELRGRGLVRTTNKPLGDIAEQVVLAARGGVLEPNSAKSHDITTTEGCRIQVKAMSGRSAGATAKFSPFRSAEYDIAVFLVFEPQQFMIAEAYEVKAELIVEHVRVVPHVNGRLATLRKVRELGIDVRPEMEAAYARLDGDVVEFRFGSTSTSKG